MMQRILDLRHNWLGILVLTVFWCFLWGNWSASDVLGGLLVAAVLFLLFPMPPTGQEIAFRPLSFIWLVLVFCVDVFRSACEVGWYSIRPGPTVKNSVVAIRLASRSDLFLTITGMLATLVPGSIVVEAQRSTGTLFLHVIGAEDEAGVELARRRVLEQEARLLKALARKDILEGAGLR
ncbi:MAG: Na+/H+ antiporter subunit E [Brachybacterium sp.]|nr:Na+/H+ antiporter subunit E [Brachybacterium sp.]